MKMRYLAGWMLAPLLISAAEPDSLRDALKQSRQALEENAYAPARVAANRAIEFDPGSAEAWAQLGRVEMLDGRFEEADKALKMALKLSPDNQQSQMWRLGLAISNPEDGSLGELLGTLPADALTGTSPEHLGRALALLWQQGRRDEVKIWLGRLRDAEILPAEKQHWLDQLGKDPGLEMKGESETAEPLAGFVQYIWGLELLETNQLAEAMQAFEVAESWFPNWTPVLREWGWTLYRMEKNEEAAEVWRRGLESAGAPGAWWVWVAQAEREAGNEEAALAALNKALEWNPDHVEVQAWKAALTEEAEPDASGGGELALLSAVYWHQLRGNTDESLALLEAAKDKNGALAYPRLEKVYDRNLETKVSQVAVELQAPYLETLSARHPENPGYVRDLGWSYWGQDRQSEALEAFNKALKLDLPAPELLLAQVVAGMSEVGQMDEALTWLESTGQELDLERLVDLLIENKRLVAAGPLLNKLWDEGQRKPKYGLMLAYASSVAGNCGETVEYLQPFMAELKPDSPEEQVDLFMETLRRCSGAAETGTLLVEHPWLKSVEHAYAPRVTQLLQDYAEVLTGRGRDKEALEVYIRVLERNPSAPVWGLSRSLAWELMDDSSANALDNNRDLVKAEPWDRMLFEAVVALEQGEDRAAKEKFAASWQQKSGTPAWLILWFDACLRLGDVEEAREVSDLLKGLVSQGQVAFLSDYAEMLTKLGNADQAASFWLKAQQNAPGQEYLMLETSRSLVESCQPENALEFLDNLMLAHPGQKLFLEKVYVLLDMGVHQEALTYLEGLLEVSPDEISYLILAAEICELQGQYEKGMALADRVLALQPEDPRALSIKGRLLIESGEIEEALAYYEKLLLLNPVSHTSMLRLRELYLMTGAKDKAREMVEAESRIHPNSAMAQNRLALTFGENRKMNQGIETIEPLAKMDARVAVPVFLFNRVSDCGYQGMCRMDQVETLLKEIVAAGREARWPTETVLVGEGGVMGGAVLVFLNLSPHTFVQVDEILKAQNAKAVLLLSEGHPGWELPLTEEHAARWQLGSDTGRWRPRIGNPQRVDLNLLAEEPEKLLNAMNREVFYWPQGDAGFDMRYVPTEKLSALRTELRKKYALGFIRYGEGYWVPGMDVHHIPAKPVPPEWTAKEMRYYLTSENPVVKAKLNMAKILYWHQQGERAESWFQIAATAGADPYEVLVNQGGNALRSGQRVYGLQCLEGALALKPDSELARKLIAEAEEDTSAALGVKWGGWKDSDKRNFEEWGVFGRLPFLIRYNAEISYDRLIFGEDGQPNEKADRFGLGFQWHPNNLNIVDAKIWYTDFEDVEGVVGGEARYRQSLGNLGGWVQLDAGREIEETLDAVEKRIIRNHGMLSVYNRPWDTTDLFLNARGIFRTDDNDTWLGDLRWLYRVREVPYLGIGYRGRIGDSDVDSPDYYAPLELEQHMLHLALRQTWDMVNLRLSAEAGYAREQDEDWKDVWSGRAEVWFDLTETAELKASIRHLETPTYFLDGADISFIYQF